MSLRLVSVAVTAIATAALAACGGGGDTTIIKKTVTETSTTPSQASGEFDPSNVFMMNFGSQEFSEPDQFSFSVNGDLVAEDLDWADWGSPTATAQGQMRLRDYPSARRVVVPGTVVVSRLAECKGASYYTDASVDVPPNAPFKPKIAELPTPCD